MKANQVVSIGLRARSWRTLIHILQEVGLGQQTKARQETYFEKFGQHFSSGPFWSLLQHIEGELEAEGIKPETWQDPRRIEDDA